MTAKNDDVTASNSLIELAHEFNNLLVGIVGNARLLQDEALQPRARDLVEELLACSERATDVTDRMLRLGDTSTEARPKEALNVPSESHCNRKTVLVIDDEEIVRSVSSAILKRAGFEVLTADSGPDGLKLYEEHKHDILCVVLDLTMPYMRGNLVFAKLKAMDSEVNVFLMSGYSDNQAMEEFDSEDILGFIQKPFQTEDLLNAVQSCVSTDSSSTEAHASHALNY
ncbi:MAG: response regulator [Bdellovibrionales bacterium]|nr:response regulator [Bdellovibrionales bacterium]